MRYTRDRRVGRSALVSVAAFLLAFVAASAAQAPPFSDYALVDGTFPIDLCAGADGNIWFTESGGARVARITPSGGVKEYLTGLSSVAAIAKGPDGNLWFTSQSDSRIGVMSTGGQLLNVFPASADPSALVGPEGIVAGPDGALWFTQKSTDRIARISLSGHVREFPVTAGSYPKAIAVGPDGNIWFSEFNAGKIGKMSTQGVLLREYSLAPASAPVGLRSDDHDLWFAESGADKVGRLTMRGNLSEYALSPGAAPRDVENDPRGNEMYIAETGLDRIARISTGGNGDGDHGNGDSHGNDQSPKITEVQLPAGSGPRRLAVAKNKAVWFTETGASRVGQLSDGGNNGHGDH